MTDIGQPFMSFIHRSHLDTHNTLQILMSDVFPPFCLDYLSSCSADPGFYS
jgi:hypothetical protein